jgi:phage shock protein A
LTDVGETLDEAEQKAEAMQARAAALDQLAGGGELVASGDDLTRQLSQLELAESVEKHLAALKRQVT